MPVGAFFWIREESLKIFYRVCRRLVLIFWSTEHILVSMGNKKLWMIQESGTKMIKGQPLRAPWTPLIALE
jgi:hypothetical protein